MPRTEATFENTRTSPENQKAIDARAAARELMARGARLMTAEDRFGETKTGWWLDGVFIGGRGDPVGCLAAVRG